MRARQVTGVILDSGSGREPGAVQGGFCGAAVRGVGGGTYVVLSMSKYHLGGAHAELDLRGRAEAEDKYSAMTPPLCLFYLFILRRSLTLSPRQGCSGAISAD